MTAQPRFEILVGLYITNDENYDKYRSAIAPLLKKHGGYFRYDFRISQMLQGQAEAPFNRIFILSFPNEKSKNRLFASQAYNKVRASYFDLAVQSGQTLASYTTPI